MTKFITEDYLLPDKLSKELFDAAKEMPIIDYHCHLSAKEIYEDKVFSNIAELWLKEDHYKWRLMRSAGIDEKYITGDADDKDKFIAWAKTIALAIGNPLYEWSHMELKNYFDYEGILDEDTALQVWELANRKLESLSAQKLINLSNVEVICTTDDPVDSLEYHLKLKDSDLKFRVYPTFRPDKALYIEKTDWVEYINKLSEVSSITIDNYASLIEALKERLDYFVKLGCKAADHGMQEIPFAQYSKEEIENIFTKRLKGNSLDKDELEKYKTSLLRDLMEEYSRLNLVSQFHYGVIRDNSSRLLKAKGNDAGGDCIGDSRSISNLAHFLNLLDSKDSLPKTIIYPLNPTDNLAIETVITCFQQGPCVSKLQHGSAWWFNDNYDGIKAQLRSLASQGYLAGFVGMLTDSRSLVSYARHEYFRRVLCNLISEFVAEGRYPDDIDKLKTIVQNVSYNNVKNYFCF